jgi:hypothetical protein
MGWLDKLLGRDKRMEDEVSPEERQRHVEQSAHPGTAPVVPPDTDEESADEPGEARQDEPEGGVIPERPRSY